MDDRVHARWHQLASRPLRSLRLGTRRVDMPELVVVPGLGALGYLLPMLHACASWTRVELLDVPGFGHQRTAGFPATLEDTSDTVAEWLRTVPRDRIILLGHSTGAQAALRAAVAAPERVAAVVPAGPTFPPEARRWAPLVRRVVRTLRHESPGEVPATFPDYLRGRGGVLTLLRTSMVDEPERLVPRLTCPAVVVRGEHDAVSPPHWAARLAEAAPRGCLVTVPGGHNFTFTNPEPAAAALRATIVAMRVNT